MFLEKKSGMPLECQTVWIRIMPDFMSGLIWPDQTVCKCYQQATKVGKELEISVDPASPVIKPITS